MLFYLCSEGEEGELRKLEALKPHRDTDNRNTIHKAENKICDRNFPASDDRPYGIGDRVLFEIQPHLLAEGHKGKLGHLEALNAKRSSDDGDTQYNAANTPNKSQPETTK